MKILITGASSYVGARLFLDLQGKHEAIGTFSEHQLSSKFIHLDVTSKPEVDAVIQKEKPEVIIHAAANADARWCEANPQKALELNQYATAYIAQAAAEIKAPVIYISSFAAVTPKNIYASTKRESEKILENTNNDYLILRPSFILGFSPNTVNDRPFNRLLRNLDDGVKAEYDTSWKFHPTHVGHIAEIIESSIEKNIWNTTIPIAVPEMKSRYDVAVDILTPFGITVSSLDKGDTTVVTPYDESELTKRGLPTLSYQTMIERIIAEIRSRERFVL